MGRRSPPLLFEAPTIQAPRVALSVKQPWATLIVHGLKTMELRRWPTKRTGLVYIHAGKKFETAPEAWERLPERLFGFAQQRGGLVGKVQLAGCRVYESLETFVGDQPRHLAPAAWFQPPRMFGFETTEAEPIAFEACRGALLFFSV